MSGKGSSKLHEKHQLILANMLREEDNKFCADCLAKGPRWASWNIGVFLCIRCAGIHRNLGVHISRVKSVNLDSWTPEQIETIQRGGNAIAKEKYEANLPSSFRRPQDDYSVEQLIRNKYERKLFISKESPVVSKATEAKSSPSSTRVKGSKKQSSNQNKDQMLAVPRPSTQTKRSTTPSPSPPPTTSTPSPATHSTPTPNLIAMETAAPVAKKETVDLLTGLETAPQGTSPQQPSPQQPSIGEDPQKAVKDNILSLYQTPQQHGYQAYTAHGYPVNPYHYQQQQLAAMRMAQQQQQQHMTIAQVREVEQQMRGLKVQQNPLTNGQPPLQPQFTATPSNTPFPQSGGGGGEWGGGGGEGGGGQTLNPHLW